MKSVFFALVISFVIVGCGDDKVPTIPEQQEGAITLTIKDEKGMPISDAGIYYNCVAQLGGSCDLGTHITELQKDTVSSILVTPLPASEQMFVWFLIPKSDHYTARLLDYNKNFLDTVYDAVAQPGQYSISVSTELDGKRLPSGVYYLELKNSKTTVYKKMVFETFRFYPVNTIIPNFITSSSGELKIPYTSVPFAEQFKRIDQAGNLLGTFTTIGNIIKFTVVKEGYKPYEGSLTIGSLQTPIQQNIVLQKL